MEESEAEDLMRDAFFLAHNKLGPAYQENTDFIRKMESVAGVRISKDRVRRYQNGENKLTAVALWAASRACGHTIEELIAEVQGQALPANQRVEKVEGKLAELDGHVDALAEQLVQEIKVSTEFRKQVLSILGSDLNPS